MAIPQETRAKWQAQITLGTGDTTKTLLAAPPAPYATLRAYCTHMVALCLVSAAQAITITAGSMTFMSLPVSWAVGNEHFFGPMVLGLPGAAATAITITPASAGPSIHVVAEGYYAE
jgi:hypothetical protein